MRNVGQLSAFQRKLRYYKCVAMVFGHRFKVVAARLSKNSVQHFMTVVTPIDVQHRGEVWEVVRLRPADLDGFQYHIRAADGLERVVHEKELVAAE